MKILWLTWKDRSHPLSGGAEAVSGEIMDRLVRDGHKVKMITAKYEKSKDHETINGLEIFRVGGRYSVYLKAKKLYKEKLNGWADVVIDEMNTIPFGSGFYNKSKNILLCYQLAREVWFHQMIFPLSFIGYSLEPIMLRVISKKYPTVLTESNSTKLDMNKYGFKNVNTFRVGMELKPLPRLGKKTRSNVILCFGSIRPMKRTLHAIKAFEIARDNNPNLKIIIAGSNQGLYARKVTKYVSKSRHSNSIDILGKVSPKKKLDLMRQADIILVTSIKEGWGLIITESNSQGTPAIAYDVDGLRDSVQDKITGLLIPNSSFQAMGNGIIDLLSNDTVYESLRHEAWQYSKNFTFENSYYDFVQIINNIAK